MNTPYEDNMHRTSDLQLLRKMNSKEKLSHSNAVWSLLRDGLHKNLISPLTERCGTEVRIWLHNLRSTATPQKSLEFQRCYRSHQKQSLGREFKSVKSGSGEHGWSPTSSAVTTENVRKEGNTTSEHLVRYRHRSFLPWTNLWIHVDSLKRLGFQLK